MNLRKSGLVLGCVLGVALAAYGLTKMTGVAMVNSTIDSTVIGGSAPANITGTVVTATNTFVGNVMGSATSLSPTPSTCGSTGTAYGIAANGGALCASTPSTQANSGYTKLPNGIILQWTVSPTIPNDTNDVYTATVSWPIAFPNHCFHSSISTNEASATASSDDLWQTIGTCGLSSQVVVHQKVGNTDGTNTFGYMFAVGN